jgi:hypothetical protein
MSPPSPPPLQANPAFWREGGGGWGGLSMRFGMPNSLKLQAQQSILGPFCKNTYTETVNMLAVRISNIFTSLFEFCDLIFKRSPPLKFMS